MSNELEVLKLYLRRSWYWLAMQYYAVLDYIATRKGGND